MSGIGIITNPYSKKNLKKPGHKIMLGYILGNKGVYQITENLDALERVAQEFKAQNIEILGINGGDGTIQRTITTFIHVYKNQPLPKIALLRGGTINIIAGNLGLKGSSKTLLLDLVEKYHEGSDFTEIPIRTIKCDNQYGFMFTGGFASTFLEEYYKNKTGPLGAALFSLKLAISALRNKGLIKKLVKNIQLTYSGTQTKEKTCTANTILASTLPSLPLFLKLFTRVAGTTSFFQLFLLKNRPVEIVYMCLKLLFRMNLSKFGMVDILTQDICIRTQSKMLIGMDGEIFGQQNTFSLSLGPVLTFIL